MKSDDAFVQAATVVTLLLLQIHLLRRVWETKFLLKYPDAARMHLIAYAFGIRHGGRPPLLAICIPLPSTCVHANVPSKMHRKLDAAVPSYAATIWCCPSQCYRQHHWKGYGCRTTGQSP